MSLSHIIILHYILLKLNILYYLFWNFIYIYIYIYNSGLIHPLSDIVFINHIPRTLDKVNLN